MSTGKGLEGSFHSVETFFPLCGKVPKYFSIVWKTGVPETSGELWRRGVAPPWAANEQLRMKN